MEESPGPNRGCRHEATREASKTAANNSNAQRGPPHEAAGCRCRRRRDSNSNSNNSSDRPWRRNNNNKHSYSHRHSRSHRDCSSSRAAHSSSSSGRAPLAALLVAAALAALALLPDLPRAAASPLPEPTPSPSPSPTPSAPRLHRRHSGWHAEYEREMGSQELEWVNPCGGLWVEPEERPRRPPVKKILHQLQLSIGREQLNLNRTDIDVSKMRSWAKHQEKYAFLPQLRPDSNVSLRRWHRLMQVYVGAFVYLRRAQLHWDHEKAQQASAVSEELLQLKRSARTILCEIETTINNTAPSSASGQRRGAAQLRFLSRDALEKRLNFTTNLSRFFAHRRGRDRSQADEVPDVYAVDLRFAKYSYRRFLRSMVKVMRLHLRRPGQVALDSRSASSAAVSAGSASFLDSSQDRSLGPGSRSQERPRQRRKGHRNSSANASGRRPKQPRRPRPAPGSG